MDDYLLENKSWVDIKTYIDLLEGYEIEKLMLNQKQGVKIMNTKQRFLQILNDAGFDLVITQRDQNSSIFVQILALERSLDKNVTEIQKASLMSIIPTLSKYTIKFKDKGGNEREVWLGSSNFVLRDATKREGPSGDFTVPVRYEYVIGINRLDYDVYEMVAENVKYDVTDEKAVI